MSETLAEACRELDAALDRFLKEMGEQSIGDDGTASLPVSAEALMHLGLAREEVGRHVARSEMALDVGAARCIRVTLHGEDGAILDDQLIIPGDTSISFSDINPTEPYEIAFSDIPKLKTERIIDNPRRANDHPRSPRESMRGGRGR